MSDKQQPVKVDSTVPFCSECGDKADLALHPPPNVYCKNPKCKLFKIPSNGVYKKKPF